MSLIADLQTQAQAAQAQAAPAQAAQVQMTKPKGPANVVMRNKQKTNDVGIYTECLITRKVPINIIYVGNNLKQTIEKEIASKVEGRCIVEGYVKPGSIKILSYSSGLIKADHIIFEVIFECFICSPVEGMHIHCIAKNITKAGIRAETLEMPSPVVIFIARDHHYMSSYFADVKENDEIKIKVIGQRFELNDKYISIIGELLNSSTTSMMMMTPRAKNVGAKNVGAKNVGAKNVGIKKPKLVLTK